MSLSMNDWNLQRFSSPENSAEHRADAGLFPAEAAILTGLPAEIRQGRILDLGVGSGRTIPFLAPGAFRYTGVDYSAAALAEARTLFPEADLRLGDARDLSEFGAAEFDLVFFGYNGIDYVDHPGRLRILAEVRRVLRPDGCFVFSFHNRDFSGLQASREIVRPNWRNNPFRLLREAVKVRAAWKRRRLLAAAEVAADEYMIVNDRGMNFGLLTYYITMEAQSKQLRGNGFGDIASFGLDGAEIDPGRPFANDFMIHMRAR
jgi:SAM-dependent methyltransferase